MTGHVRQAAQKALSLGRIAGDIIWRAYINHLLVFSIGAALGAVVGLTAAMTVFLGLLKSRGLL